ncbi:MAG: choice-of-anchor J domain-containing protein, partial [Bacteroidales bacterium]|nr:choice-of-anchor J domain-containing protein [Bacteroidales bacterium]
MVKKSLLLLMVLLFAGFTSIKAQETIVFDFENDFAAGSLLGMTTIDADGDGYDWYVRPTGLSQLGHGDSNGFMTSASYQGAALTPDNYLVTPQGQYASINFFASAQDPSWPVEHFGVAVSTASGTSAADFTTIEEWDMSAKSLGNNMTVGRDGRQTKAGAWYEYTVDLSAYAGQDIYVAIRHFDCTDMFRLNVDDITLTVPDNNVVIDFETGDFSQYDFNNTSSYAWTVVEEDGNHYMKSGNAGVASSTSTISATHVFESDGYIAFDYNCMGEGSSTFWDHCDFAIDGTQIFTHGADHQGWDSFLQELAAGSHTFTWSYTKD